MSQQTSSLKWDTGNSTKKSIPDTSSHEIQKLLLQIEHLKTMYTDEVESTIDFMSTCTDENFSYTGITESIDALVAGKNKLGEINSSGLNSFENFISMIIRVGYASKRKQFENVASISIKLRLISSKNINNKTFSTSIQNLRLSTDAPMSVSNELHSSIVIVASSPSEGTFPINTHRKSLSVPNLTI